MTVLILALLVVLVASPPLLAVLRRARVLDHPSSRSSHLRPTPRGGGLAVVLAVLVAIAFAVRADAVDLPVLLPAVITLVGLGGLGLLEDVRGVPVRRRLCGQVLVGALAGAAGGVEGASAWGAIALGVAVVVYANAFNFMDGVNGISSINAAFAGLAYAGIAARFDAVEVILVGLAVAGAALGFLPFNFPSARVFLGDSGSYAIGGVIAVLAVQCRVAGAPLLLCLAPCAVYLADTGFTLLDRARRGDSLVAAHRQHAYQRLADSAVGHVGAAASTVLVTAALTGVAWLCTDAPAVLGGAVMAVLLACYLAAPLASPLLAPGTGPDSGARLATVSDVVVT